MSIWLQLTENFHFFLRVGVLVLFGFPVGTVFFGSAGAFVSFFAGFSSGFGFSTSKM